MKLTKIQRAKIKEAVEGNGDYLDDVLNKNLHEIVECLPEIMDDEGNEDAINDGVAYARAVFFHYDLDKYN